MVENLKLLNLSRRALEAVMDEYTRRPDFYDRVALCAYDGESPNLPICRRSPLERLVLWGCMVPEICSRMRSLGIPEPVIRDAFYDISLRAGLYEKKYRKPGLTKEDVIWNRHVYHGQIFKLGSLQFQLFSQIYLDQEGCAYDYMTFSAEQKCLLPPGSPVLNVHIQEGADLSAEAVEQSFAMARDFFPRYFPEHRARAFVCYSWLLYPGLQDLLPENSKIREFASRFRIVGSVCDPYGSDSVRRIYGKRCRRKGDYPQKTTLQRNALGNFSKLGMGCGVIEII